MMARDERDEYKILYDALKYKILSDTNKPDAEYAEESIQHWIDLFLQHRNFGDILSVKNQILDTEVDDVITDPAGKTVKDVVYSAISGYLYQSLLQDDEIIAWMDNLE